MPADRVQAAGALMNGFAARTGIAAPRPGRVSRYLWTDAFALCDFLSLHLASGDARDLQRALRLVEQVHHVLGRHRDDDSRRGWISGLGEREGEAHPTAGGLRIGKRLPERGPADPWDAALEWDRDGQYFHYLTRWMHALDRTSLVTGDRRYSDWALELAAAARRGFVRRDAPGGRAHLCWKMSVDLSRVQVPSMGQLDPLDGFVTFARLQATRDGNPDPHGPDLADARDEMLGMCTGQSWVTTDALGIGGVLGAVAELTRLVAEGHVEHLALLDEALQDARLGLRAFDVHGLLHHPAERRLAFRELGLSIGLRGLDGMRDDVRRAPHRFRDEGALLCRIEALAQYQPLAEVVERFWLEPAHQDGEAWSGHRDINSVMLAASLLAAVPGGLDDLGAPVAARTRDRRS